MREIKTFMAFDDTVFNNLSDCCEYEDKMRKDLCFYKGKISIPLDNIIEDIDDANKVVVKSRKALNSLNKILNILSDNEYYRMFKMCNNIGTYRYDIINKCYFKLIREDDAMKILSEDNLGRNFIFHDIDGYWWYKI